MEFIGEIIDATPNISVITQIKALSWINPDKSKEKIIQEFISDSTILMLSSEITAECIKIRRSRKIKTPDAIIAATAIINNYTLVSNDSDFIGIQNLKLLNPNNF